MTFDDLNKKYAGKKLRDDFEDLGNALLAPYGLSVVYGDHQVMVRVGGESDDPDDFNAYACAMWMDDNDLVLDNVHVEFMARYPENEYDPSRHNLTDEEYERGTSITDEFLEAVTE